MNINYQRFYDNNTIPAKISRAVRRLFSADARRESRQLKIVARLCNNNFMPPAPDITNAVMQAITADLTATYDPEEAAVSVRGWVIAGCLLVLSLVSAYFGGDFLKIASLTGVSFLLPVGITIGCAVIAYVAVFVGTHLEILSKKFGIDDNEIQNVSTD
jgi:hypothetical protein